MITWGISANSHNAAVAVFANERLVFASETERWSGIKNDPDLDKDLIYDLHYKGLTPDRVIWYERPLLKTIRQLEAGQGWCYKENNIKRYLKEYLPSTPIKYVSHHKSHAAGGYYTSGFNSACIVVIDAIGEYESLSIWSGVGEELHKVYSLDYPNSIGLFYSAMTQRCGLKPNEEEYILMGMAAYGNPKRLWKEMMTEFISLPNDDWGHIFRLKKNLHRGCLDWRPDLTTEQDIFDIAAATQYIYEMIFERILMCASQDVDLTPNLVIAGGCALNCVANRLAGKYFNNVWIMPAPGDSGSAIGAVLAANPNWRMRTGEFTPFLGHDMGSHVTNHEIVSYLEQHQICGVARGRAEFGPRALGNRSLLADPRGNDIKEQVNAIKQRQQFRPFAPAILEELCDTYFDMPSGWSDSRYMQVVARCRVPDLFPAVIHADGTSRVQTVPKDGSKFRELLEIWYDRTGCPMLLNTSLNVKGKPMVNDVDDALEFQNTYNVKVFT
jgi:carbamoyltransferase